MEPPVALPRFCEAVVTLGSPGPRLRGTPGFSASVPALVWGLRNLGGDWTGN